MSEYEQQNKQILLARGRTSEIYLYEPGKLLKLYRSDWPKQAVEQEMDILKTINDLEIPSPHVYEKIEIGDRNGLVLERIKGESLTSELKKHPLSLLHQIKMAAELQAKINTKSSKELPSQRNRLIKEIKLADIEGSLKTKVLAIIDALPDNNRVCHGDYHIDNLFITDKGLVVLDWAAATIGNPIADLARTLLLIRVGAPPEHTPVLDRVILGVSRTIMPLDNLYLEEYSKHLPVLSDQLNSWIIVSAVARLSENYPEERQKLLAIVKNIK